MAHETPFSSSYRWTYDVFLNFRGEDTRFGFTRNLYNALHQKGIVTFMDDEGLRRGQEITPALVKAIQQSRIAITIFSRNYASSTFCLDELAQILQCIKDRGRLVLPIFYDVDPSQVRHQRENYREAFAKHETRFKNDKEKVCKWRLALQHAANLSGLHFRPGHEYECHFIEGIVKEVSRRINRRPLHIADYPVGLESRVQKVISLLDSGSDEEVRMVGICGIGGIGKTTIARAVCNLISDSFDGFCFLADVRENSLKHGLVYLQEMLLSEIVEEDIKLGYVNKGIPIIKHRLHRKKVLLVLDDVNKLKQLQIVAGGLDWFDSGSRIIITTRDKHLLARHRIERIYEVESLNQEEALELLKWNAGKQNGVDPSYMEMLNNVVLYACGLPLALEVIGSNLFNKGVDDWRSALDTYKRIPIKEVQQVLKVSYDALEEHEQEIFLDIACCFKGDTLEYVTSALHACGRCPDYGIKVLIDKCLIKIDSGHVAMHALIQDMGREIIRKQSPNEPGKCTRLWFHKDILQVLEKNEGTEKIEAINLDVPGYKEVDWNGKAFKKMPNLKILIIRNAHFSTGPKYLPNSLRVLEWKGYPYPSLPSDFCPKELIILKMPENRLMLDKQLKNFQSLSMLDFRGSTFLRRVPDLSGVPNLTELCLESCTNLTEVPVSIGSLNKLKRLSVKGCTQLKNFAGISSTSLEFLDLTRCSSLRRFPEILGTMENIRDVCLNYSGIEELPFSFGNLLGLQKLQLTQCKRLKEVRGIPPNLKELSALDCPSLSSQSCSILLSQALHESGNTQFFITGNKIPDWFDHYTVGNSVSFWIRKKFPDMAVCFCAIIAIMHGGPAIHLCIRINDEIIAIPDCLILDGGASSENIFLFDLRQRVSEAEVESVVLEREWNHVEIFCTLCCSTFFEDDNISATTVKWSGVHVYKQKSRMEDIRFTDPNEESLPEFLDGLSTNPNTSADFVLRRCQWPHIDFRVIKGNTNKAGISILSEPEIEIQEN